MKISTIVFALIVLGLLAVGVMIERYGRTCPGCQRRKQAIADLLSGGSEDDTIIQSPNGGPALVVAPDPVIPTQVDLGIAQITPLVTPQVV